MPDLAIGRQEAFELILSLTHFVDKEKTIMPFHMLGVDRKHVAVTPIACFDEAGWPFLLNLHESGVFKVQTSDPNLFRPARRLFLIALLMTVSQFVLAVEVGERVRVRDGSDYRTGTVLGTLGISYRVSFDDGRQPNESILNEQQFVSDSEVNVQAERRE